ncbi:pyridoxamine 5'-phosphate oxidase family protein [Rhodococcus pyridinivorans]|uniref:pyridoxamine 5'-phosphate oxidase family protein n=1 Tax=Rhodococcus pyridinivorans TaxID=103816 RepID=UPI00110E5863|nr:pyridoxamine 5'-phosphate oxidase family protein [Rhodococcus pyridinivorans]
MRDNPNTHDPVVPLDEDQCWDLLATGKVGRLVTVVGGRPEIYPVNYVTDDRTVYFRSGEGSKLSELAVHPQVAFEVDEIREDSAWSVVLHGHARILRSFDDAARIDALGLSPWVPTPKYDYVALTATDLTGMQLTLVKR